MSFSDLLKTLREDYLHSLPEKISDIRGQISKHDKAALQSSFHKLKGTGRTYGLPEVSEVAEAVESVCIHSPEHAVLASEQGAQVLEDIALAYSSEVEFSLSKDPRFSRIRQLLSPTQQAA